MHMKTVITQTETSSRTRTIIVIHTTTANVKCSNVPACRPVRAQLDKFLNITKKGKHYINIHEGKKMVNGDGMRLKQITNWNYSSFNGFIKNVH